MKREIGKLLSFILFVVTILAISGDVSANIKSKFEASLKKIAKERKINEQQIETVNTIEVNLPLSGVQYFSSKVLDKTTGEFFEINVDAEGNPVNAQELGEREDMLYRDKYGKLTPELYQTLSERTSSDIVTVGFWIGLPDLPDGNDLKTGNLEMSEDELEAVSKQRDAQVANSVRNNTAAFVESLRAMGLEPETFDFSPIIVVKMTVERCCFRFAKARSISSDAGGRKVG